MRPVPDKIAIVLINIDENTVGNRSEHPPDAAGLAVVSVTRFNSLFFHRWRSFQPQPRRPITNIEEPHFFDSSRNSGDGEVERSTAGRVGWPGEREPTADTPPPLTRAEVAELLGEWKGQILNDFSSRSLSVARTPRACPLHGCGSNSDLVSLQHEANGYDT